MPPLEAFYHLDSLFGHGSCVAKGGTDDFPLPEPARITFALLGTQKRRLTMRAPTIKLRTADLLWPTVERLDKKLLAIDRERLDLDFRDVDFITAAALGKLITVRRKRNLVFHNVQPAVYNVFEVTGVSALFDMDRLLPKRGVRSKW